GRGVLCTPVPGQGRQCAEAFPEPQGLRPLSVGLRPVPTIARNAVSPPQVAAAPGPEGPGDRTVPPRHRPGAAPLSHLPAASKVLHARQVRLPCNDGPPTPAGPPPCREIVPPAPGQFAGGPAGGYS